MKFVITSNFGVIEDIRNGRVHEGIDLATPMDTPLRSFCDGVVEKVVNYGNKDIGKGIIIKAKNGVEYIYGHMDRVDVHAGQKIHEGTLLGMSGSTGHSTGPHLHFGEKIDGQFVDPSNVIGKVDHMSGWNGTVENIGWKEIIKEAIFNPDLLRDHMQIAIMSCLTAAGTVLMHLLFSGVLIGAGMLVILKTLGFEHRWLKPSVLVGGYVMLKFLFGGA